MREIRTSVKSILHLCFLSGVCQNSPSIDSVEGTTLLCWLPVRGGFSRRSSDWAAASVIRVFSRLSAPEGHRSVGHWRERDRHSRQGSGISWEKSVHRTCNWWLSVDRLTSTGPSYNTRTARCNPKRAVVCAKELGHLTQPITVHDRIKSP